MDEGWTIDALHTHLDQEFKDLRELIAAKFDAVDKATVLAAVAVERRFESVNEFRKQLADQERNFLTRAEFDAHHETLVNKLDQEIARLTDLELRVSTRIEAQASNQQATYRFIGWGFALFGAIMTLVIFATDWLFH